MFSQNERQIIKEDPAKAYRCLSARAIDAGRYDLKPIFQQLFPDNDVDMDFDIATYNIANLQEECNTYIEQFNEFNEVTDLGYLVENVYYNGREVLVASDSKSSKYLIYKEGDLYWRTEKEKDGDTLQDDSLIASLDLKIRNIYTDLTQTYIVYRLPLDRQDRTEELQTALDKIKGTAFLSQTQTNALWRLLTDIAPEFLELNRDIKTQGVTIRNGTIEVTIDPTFDAVKIINQLVKLYEVTEDKNAFNFLLLYTPFTVFGYEFRKTNLIVPFVIYYGGGGVGKSALTRKMVVKGLNNPQADLTEQDVWTLAAFRERMMGGNYPKFIDEVSADWMMKYSSHLKAMTTGKGSSSRGKRVGGVNQWDTTATPFFVSNEYITDQYAFNRRAFLLLAEGRADSMNPAIWLDAARKIPDGFLYIFLNELNGKNIEDVMDGIVATVHNDEDYVFSYLSYMLNIVKAVFERHGIKCPFELPHKDEVEYRWEEIFMDYLLQQKHANDYGELRDKNYLKKDEDFRYTEDRRTGDIVFEIKKIGYEKFLNSFHRCPYKDMKTFSLNAGGKNFEYAQKSWDSRTTRVLRVTLKGERTILTDTDITV